MDTEEELHVIFTCKECGAHDAIIVTLEIGGELYECTTCGKQQSDPSGRVKEEE